MTTTFLGTSTTCDGFVTVTVTLIGGRTVRVAVEAKETVTFAVSLTI